ncbi:MAG: hypothetical protein LUD72_05610 [Bacteroidales bacterium]|nr:hypothetical protein [Bacteroidales bacterium]
MNDEDDILKYKEMAEMGDADAQNRLGYCYGTGTGVREDMAEAVKWYKKAAEQGLPVAQFNYGNCLLFGTGVEKNEEVGIAWLWKSAEQGYLHAQDKLGTCYKTGLGTGKDLSEAIRLYESAALHGYAPAQYHLGLCYVNGEAVDRNDVEALKWFRKAAEKGYADAQYEIGLYYFGKGPNHDFSKAVEWYKKAADLGHTDAQFALGLCFVNGEGVTQDYDKGMKWFEKSAEGGNVHSQYLFGLRCCDEDWSGHDFEKGVKWLKVAAENGETQAQDMLAEYYINGRCGLDVDYSEALKWINKALPENRRETQYKYAFLLANGYGIPKDLTDAFIWFNKSAEQKYADAEVYLGLFYEYGIVVEKNRNKAVEWFKKAAEHGSGAAMTNMGCICHERDVSGKNAVKAVSWWEKGTEIGEPSSMYYLALCYAEGYGVVKSFEMAVELLSESANLEYAKAEFLLGRCYLTGDILGKNNAMSEEFLARAARHGDIDALFLFARLFENGIPKRIAKNSEKAAYIYEKIIERQESQFIKDDDADLAYAFYRLAGIKKTSLDEEGNLERQRELYGKAKELGFSCDAQIAATEKSIATLSEKDFEDKTKLDLLMERMKTADKPMEEIPGEVDILLKDVFGGAWTTIESSVGDILRTGLVSYVTFAVMDAKTGSNSDYSPVVLQLCKAFEIVLCDVFVKGYIKYLKEEGVDPLYFSNVPGCPIAKFFPFVKQDGGKYKYVNMNNDKILTLGNLGYFVGLNPREYDEDGAGSQALDTLIPPSKKMEKNMAAYCLRKIFKRSAFSDCASLEINLQIGKT